MADNGGLGLCFRFEDGGYVDLISLGLRCDGGLERVLDVCNDELRLYGLLARSCPHVLEVLEFGDFGAALGSARDRAVIGRLCVFEEFSERVRVAKGGS